MLYCSGAKRSLLRSRITLPWMSCPEHEEMFTPPENAVTDTRPLLVIADGPGKGSVLGCYPEVALHARPSGTVLFFDSTGIYRLSGRKKDWFHHCR